MSHVLVFNTDQAIATFLMRVFIGRHVRTGDASASTTGAAAGAGVGSGAVSIGSQHNLLATAHEAMWGFPYAMQHAPYPILHAPCPTRCMQVLFCALISFVQHFADPHLICAHLNGGFKEEKGHT